MRSGPVGTFTLLAVATMLASNLSASAEPPVAVHVGGDDLSLHELCESLARACWDLDPEELGMNPVTATLPPAPEGNLVELDDGENVVVHAGLLGQKIKVHGVVTVEQKVAWGSDEDDTEPFVPCGDPAGCPDLTVDELTLLGYVTRSTETFDADHCAVQEGSTEAGERDLLRFAFRSPNLGSGDLVIGDPDDHPEWFEWGQCHEHWHFKEYGDYRLWTPAGYAAWKLIRAAYPHALPEEILDAFPELRDLYRAGHKQGFCVIDLYNWYYTTSPAKYDDCFENQGISVYYADEYASTLDGQWIDVTGLEPGAYVLEAEVNPERFFAEESYMNNDAAYVVDVNVDWRP